MTGVQTCALPISLTSGDAVTVLGTADTAYRPALAYCEGFVGMGSVVLPKLHATDSRSEERRVGKECRSRWWRYH